MGMSRTGTRRGVLAAAGGVVVAGTAGATATASVADDGNDGDEEAARDPDAYERADPDDLVEVSVGYESGGRDHVVDRAEAISHEFAFDAVRVVIRKRDAEALTERDDVRYVEPAGKSATISPPSSFEDESDEDESDEERDDPPTIPGPTPDGADPTPDDPVPDLDVYIRDVLQRLLST